MSPPVINSCHCVKLSYAHKIRKDNPIPIEFALFIIKTCAKKSRIAVITDNHSAPKLNNGDSEIKAVPRNKARRRDARAANISHTIMQF